MVSPQSVGGYDCEFVEPPPSAFQVECPVCLLKLRNPCQVSCCGNNFCEPCIKRISSQKCPTCKTAFTTFLNKGLKRSLNQLQVHCTYHNDTGCKWKGELGQLEQHLNLNPNPQKRHVGCEFVKLECRHDCGEHPLRCLIRKHENEDCRKRPFCCKYCKKYKSTFEDVETNHWPECRYYPVPCPNNCAAIEIERQNLQQHISEECLLTVVNCDFHYAGCEVQVHRKDIPSHLAENVGSHLRLISTQNQMLVKQIAQNETLIERLTKDQQQSHVNQRQLRDELKQKNDHVTLKLQQERSASKKEVDQLRQSQEQETQIFRRKVGHMAQSITKLTELQSASKRRVEQLNQSQVHTQTFKQMVDRTSRLIAQLNEQQSALERSIDQLRQLQDQETQSLKRKIEHIGQNIIQLTEQQSATKSEVEQLHQSQTQMFEEMVTKLGAHDQRTQLQGGQIQMLKHKVICVNAESIAQLTERLETASKREADQVNHLHLQMTEIHTQLSDRVDQLAETQAQETKVLEQKVDLYTQRITQLREQQSDQLDQLRQTQSDQIAQLNQQQSATEWWLKLLWAIIIVLIAIIAILGGMSTTWSSIHCNWSSQVDCTAKPS